VSIRGRRNLDGQVVIAVGLILVALYSIRTSIGLTDWLVLAAVIPSIILHEVAHGATALAFGDDTAKRAGRVTLNPIRHVDPVGTLVLPGLLALSGLGVFGYAKPVPVNPARMRHPRNHSLVVSLAGPAANLALAGAAALVLRFARPAHTASMIHLVSLGFGVGLLGVLDRTIFLVGFVNITLAAFNALPIPPLDGSAILERLLPPRALPQWRNLTRYAMLALLVLVLLDRGRVLGQILGPVERAYARAI
jgi:Zn-dependent protease